MTQKEEPVKMAIDDAELNAMAEIAKVLEGVTPEAQGRVLAWVNARFGVRTDQIQLRGGAAVGGQHCGRAVAGQSGHQP